MDPENVLTLLKIMDLANQWPALKPFHDYAEAELLDGIVKVNEDLALRAEKKAAAAAKIKAEAEAKAKPRAIPADQLAGDEEVVDRRI